MCPGSANPSHGVGRNAGATPPMTTAGVAIHKFGGSLAASGRAWNHPSGAGTSVPACRTCGPSHAQPLPRLLTNFRIATLTSGATALASPALGRARLTGLGRRLGSGPGAPLGSARAGSHLDRRPPARIAPDVERDPDQHDQRTDGDGDCAAAAQAAVARAIGRAVVDNRGGGTARRHDGGGGEGGEGAAARGRWYRRRTRSRARSRGRSRRGLLRPPRAERHPRGGQEPRAQGRGYRPGSPGADRAGQDSRPHRSEASGCSIAGVFGGLR
jgi:hypothetical protein